MSVYCIFIYFRRWWYRSAVYYYYSTCARAHIVLVSGDNLRYAIIITLRAVGTNCGGWTAVGFSGGEYVNRTRPTDYRPTCELFSVLLRHIIIVMSAAAAAVSSVSNDITIL